MDRCTSIFYFEDAIEVEMELVLKKTPWSFDNSLLVVHKLKPCMFPSNIAFDSTTIWLQIHYLPMDCRVYMIAGRVARTYGYVLEVDKFSLSSGMMRFVRVCICFDLT